MLKQLFITKLNNMCKFKVGDIEIHLIVLGRSEPPIEELTFPRVMMVSLSKKEVSKRPLKRVVLGQYNNNYIALEDIDTLEAINSGCQVIIWSNAWEVEPEQKPQFVELTIQDISEGKGVGVNPALIRIKK